MSDRTRHSDALPRDRAVIVIATSDDAKTDHLIRRIRELVTMDTVVVAPPPRLALTLPDRREFDSMMTKLLSLPAFVEMPPRRRKSKWRKPETKGRR